MSEPSAPASPQPEPRRSQADLEAEIVRTRSELASTIDELTTRLDPRVQAAHAAASAKQAATDAGSLLKGDGLPHGDPARSRNVKVLVGATIAGVAVVVVAILRRRS